jgi:quinol monooxygenase YgiN
MIFIAVTFPVRPERTDEWLHLVDEFTRAVRTEPGNLFFEWSRSLEEPNTFVLLEAFRDADAGRAHVESEHFRKAIGSMPDLVAATPRIINVDTPQEGWGPMAEVQPRG